MELGVVLRGDRDLLRLLPRSRAAPGDQWRVADQSESALRSLLSQCADEPANRQGLCELTGIDEADNLAGERLRARVPDLVQRIQLGDLVLWVRDATTPDEQEVEVGEGVSLADLARG